jgi:isovaleryl-CoA dehydrogenase
MPALSPEQQTLQSTARELSQSVLRPNAEQVDKNRVYPEENLGRLGEAGLLGLLVPTAYGGKGGSLSDLAIACEAFGWGCASTAMCFLMHCCGCALIGAGASAEQAERWLAPAASGRVRTTLAFSERISGAHFYQPEISAQRSNGTYRLSGRKSFVTSGGHAGLYPVLVKSTGGDGLDVLLVTPDMNGVTFEGRWEGLGLAGNSSIALVLNDVPVPTENLLGKEGEGLGFVFNVVAPTFLVGLAAVNVGIAQAALDAAVEHAKERHYASGSPLAEIPAIQEYLANMSVSTQAARQLVTEAARAASATEPEALPLVMQAKISASEASAAVTEQAMRVGGGLAYGRLSPIERFWRDAQAGAVMAPTNDVLRVWLGKTLTGLPLF